MTTLDGIKFYGAMHFLCLSAVLTCVIFKLRKIEHLLMKNGEQKELGDKTSCD